MEQHSKFNIAHHKIICMHNTIIVSRIQASEQFLSPLSRTNISAVNEGLTSLMHNKLELRKRKI